MIILYIALYIDDAFSLQTDRNERITQTQNWFDIFLVFLRSLLYGHRFFYIIICLALVKSRDQAQTSH